MYYEFLKAPIIVSSISVILVIVIVIIDRIVNNYGPVTININGKKDINAKGGGDLLRTLSENKIFLPSACGGRGSCGACKVKVLSDVGPILPTELPFLTKEEISENIRLSCQIKVKTDLNIEVPEELFNVQQFRGRVEKINDLTHDIKEVLIKLEDDQEISFTAGQYGQLEVPPYDKIKHCTQRAYSISSNPVDTKHIEFIIRLVPGGIVTTYVHKSLIEGETVKIIGPFGDFRASDTGAQMICVAGGSGMAPFKSMFYYLLDNLKSEREIWYFFGARTKKDLFYLNELNDLSGKYANFHFVPALSEPDQGDNWDGETGLITDVLDKYLKNNVSKDISKEGYLCGSPGMIGACVKVLTANEIEKDKIFYDSFA